MAWLFQRRPEVDPGRIKIEVDGNRAIPRGSVRPLPEKKRVERVAWSATSVLSVDDQLTIEPR